MKNRMTLRVDQESMKALGEILAKIGTVILEEKDNLY